MSIFLLMPSDDNVAAKTIEERAVKSTISLTDALRVLTDQGEGIYDFAMVEVSPDGITGDSVAENRVRLFLEPAIIPSSLNHD